MIHLYAIRNRFGRYFNGGWTDEIREARFYPTVKSCRTVVSGHLDMDPTMEIVGFELVERRLLPEAERISKAKVAREKRQRREALERARYRAQSAKEQLERASRDLEKLGAA